MSSYLSIESYDIDAKLLTENYDMECQTSIILRNTGNEALETITFYLHPEFIINEIKDSNGKILNFDTKLVDTPLSITLNLMAINVKLGYKLRSGESRKLGLLYKGWIHSNAVRSQSCGYICIGKESVFLRSFFYSLWFPTIHLDDEGINDNAMFHLELNIPTNLHAIAFGLLISERIRDGRNHTIWETQQPIPIHFPMICAGTWQLDGNDKFRIYHYDSVESKRAAEIYCEVGQALWQGFHRYYGSDLPDASYFLAELDVPSGGYASINTVGLSKNAFKQILDPEQKYRILAWLGHEMVHEHIRTAIEVDAPGAAVIFEGFTLYFHLPILAEILGTDFEKWDLKRRWIRYERGLSGGEDEEGKLPPDKPLVNISMEMDEYPEYKDRFLLSDKVQIILHHLRKQVGSDTFMKAVSKYLMAHRTVPATIKGFQKAIEKESGRDLKCFFHRWFETTEILPIAWKEEDLAPV